MREGNYRIRRLDTCVTWKAPKQGAFFDDTHRVPHKYLDPSFLDRLLANEEAQEDPVAVRPQMTPIGEPPYTRADPNMPDEIYPHAPSRTNITLQPSNKTLRVKVLDTPALRQIGFQNTPEPTDYDGLLFKWPGDAQAKLHNAGVDFPVSATFFDGEGMYRDHFHMLPHDGTAKQPNGTHRYALEVPSRDWDALGLGPGASFSMAAEKDESKNEPMNFGSEKAPGVIASRDKVSKASVNYRPATGEHHCGNCDMYSNGTCSLVSGLIDPQHVCDRWEAR